MARREKNVWLEGGIAIAVAIAVMGVGFLGLIAARPILQREGLINTLCVVDRTLVFQRSALGISANKQLGDLKERMEGEIITEKAQIDRTVNKAEASTRLTALQARVQQENAHLEQVRRYAIGLVIQEIAPIIRREAARARCTAILDRSAIIDFGSAIDLTAPIVTVIDREVPPLPSKSLERASVLQ